MDEAITVLEMWFFIIKERGEAMSGPNTGRNSKNNRDGSSHETTWDKKDNSRVSYDIKADKSGGWRVSNVHSTDQSKSKGSNNHK